MPGHEPSLRTLKRLAQMYTCDIGDLVEDGRYSHLDEARRAESDLAEGEADEVRRRTLLLAGGVAAADVVLDSKPSTASMPVDPAIVDHFAALRALFVGSDNRLGPGSVFPSVKHQLALIAEFRRQTRGLLHDQLLCAQARWAEFAGWLCDDLGDPAGGAWWLGQSLSMAHEANDPDFSAYLLARTAQRAVGTVDEDRVLGLAQAATRVGTFQPHVLAFAMLQRAHGHAIAGDTFRFEGAIGEARGLVEDRTASESGLGSFCTVPYVMAQEGDGWLRLGRPEKAAERISRALDIWPASFRRDRGLYLSRVATARLANRQIDEAAAAGLEALELGRLTRSTRIRREVTSLGERLAPMEHRPAVAPLLAALAASAAVAP